MRGRFLGWAVSLALLATASVTDARPQRGSDGIFPGPWREITQEIRLLLDTAGVGGCSQAAGRRSIADSREYLISCTRDGTNWTNWRIRLASDPALELEDAWTVVTMARNGAWGVASDISTNRAIARAIADCKTRLQAEIGCGAAFITIRAGWTLGLRCGDENIIVADKELVDAERAAINRENEVRRLYAVNMPACARVLTVDPSGATVAPEFEYAGQIADPSSETELYADSPATEQSMAHPPELGFADDGASVAEVYARAKHLGLELCPAEVGPQLRLQYLDQPVGEFLHIAMEPIATDGGDLVDLTVANGGAGLLLVGGSGPSNTIKHATARYVFVRPTRIAQPAVPRNSQ